MPRRTHNPHTEEIRSLYASGMLQREIAQRFSLCDQRISQLVHGIESPRKRKEWDWDLDKIKELRDNGYRWKEVASELGVTVWAFASLPNRTEFKRPIDPRYARIKARRQAKESE